MCWALDVERACLRYCTRERRIANTRKGGGLMAIMDHGTEMWNGTKMFGERRMMRLQRGGDAQEMHVRQETEGP